MQAKGLTALDVLSTPGHLVSLAARGFTRLSEARLKPLGFGVGYLPVLVALRDGVASTQRDLARFARTEQPPMAQMLARMERDGLILRAPDPDRRTKPPRVIDRNGRSAPSERDRGLVEWQPRGARRLHGRRGRAACRPAHATDRQSRSDRERRGGARRQCDPCTACGGTIAGEDDCPFCASRTGFPRFRAPEVQLVKFGCATFRSNRGSAEGAPHRDAKRGCVNAGKPQGGMGRRRMPTCLIPHPTLACPAPCPSANVPS